jgi:hypothetical protein
MRPLTAPGTWHVTSCSRCCYIYGEKWGRYSTRALWASSITCLGNPRTLALQFSKIHVEQPPKHHQSPQIPDTRTHHTIRQIKKKELTITKATPTMLEKETNGKNIAKAKNTILSTTGGREFHKCELENASLEATNDIRPQ